MKSPNFRVTTRQFVLTIAALTLLLACRTLDLVTGQPVPPASELVAQQAQPSEPPAVAPTPRATRVPAPTREPVVSAPTVEPPTELPPPTDEPPPPPPTAEPTETRKPIVPTKQPLPTVPPTPEGPTPTAAPTRCPQRYCVSYRGCQTDGNTIIEGIVYNNGVPESGVAVRVAKEPGAYPIVEFVSGTDPVNPGKPDPANPGRYILQIVAGAPREGNWWVFVVDVPNGTKQISEAKLIHTNDDPTNPANCQHAFVDFVR